MKKADMKILGLCLVVIFSAGCAKLAHLQELLTLKAYSDEQEAQTEYVKEQDAKFDKLVQTIKDGKLAAYRNQAQIRKDFGDPVLHREAQRDGVTYQLWLYRYTLRFFDSDKVYLYFDDKGLLKHWEYVPYKKPDSGNQQESKES